MTQTRTAKGHFLSKAQKAALRHGGKLTPTGRITDAEGKFTTIRKLIAAEKPRDPETGRLVKRPPPKPMEIEAPEEAPEEKSEADLEDEKYAEDVARIMSSSDHRRKIREILDAQGDNAFTRSLMRALERGEFPAPMGATLLPPDLPKTARAPGGRFLSKAQKTALRYGGQITPTGRITDAKGKFTTTRKLIAASRPRNKQTGAFLKRRKSHRKKKG